MKKVTTLLLAIVSFACSNAQKKEFSKEALSEKLTTIEGSEMTFGEILEKFKGKSLVIEVWASWCGDCVKSMPKTKELQASNPEVNYVFISMDKTTERWKEAIEKHEIIGNHFFVNDGMKGALGKALDVDWIPRYIVIDKNGKIVLYRAIETDFEKINNVLKKIN
jgi:thiol-disulfide isomerase/thioredoxin